MTNNYMRIQIDANASYLVYQRGFITEYSKIEKKYDFDMSALDRAKSSLQQYVSFERQAMRGGDTLKEKGSESILKMLKAKRKKYARQCLESKSPINKAKHVGVEIEFISSSDRDDIAEDLATLGLEKYVELKHDGSVSGDSDGDCDGSCRDNCECFYCSETHYCHDESDCNRRRRNYGSHSNASWDYREECTECTDTETLDNCDCGGNNAAGESVCNGEHVICSGHCPGHHCQGSDDHPDYDCNCECTCGSSDCGHEIAIVARSSEIAEVIRKVCKVLGDHGATVNDTCGLHVHVDARGYDKNKMFANLVKSQRLLYSMVPKSRYNNDYCKPNLRGNSMESYSGRYWGINPASYGEHKTIEIRLHSGTVNAEKINNWILLLQKLAYAKSVKEIKSLNDLTSKVKLPAKTIDYIKERIVKFKKDHKTYSIDLNEECNIAA